MKIAIDCRLLSTRLTGIGYYVFNLLKELSRIDANNKYKLLYNHKRSRYDVIGNPDLHHYLPHEKNFELCKIRMPVEIYDRLVLRLSFPNVEWFTGKINILHGPSFYPWPVSRAKYVLTVHDLTSFKVPDTVRIDLCHYYQRCHRLSIPKADMIIADSEFTKMDIMDLFGIPEQRIKVVHLGALNYFNHFRNCPSENESSIDSYILCVGTLEPRKNQVNLIRAYNILKARHHIPHKLVLAGQNGWRSEEILAEASKSNFSDEIVLNGYLSQESLGSLYKGAALFAYVSIYEGFGLPILEAMAAGVPVVYANNTSMVEVAGDAGIGVDAYDVESIADGIYKLIDNPTLAKELSEKGRQRAALFTWEKTARETLKVYEEVGN